MKCSLHGLKIIKLIFVRFLIISFMMCVEGECLRPNKHVKAMLMDFDYLVGQLYVQHCSLVEIGEGFCALFIELPIDVGGRKPLLRQIFFGHCQCSEFRSWQLCSSQLSQQRSDDCAFDEAGSCSGTSARVHRRLCDVTGMSQWNPQCNCSIPLAGLSQDILCGFRTCFTHPLPASICMPRTVCGTAKCDASPHGALYSVKCDRHCKHHQPFCERPGPTTSHKREVLSQWSNWKPTSNSDSSNIQQYEAECLDKSRQPAFDCLGPGILCCGKEEVDCICEVKQEEDRLKAFRFTISFPTTSSPSDHNGVKVRSAGYKLHPQVWHRFMDLKDDSSDSLFSNHRPQRRRNHQKSPLRSGNFSDGGGFVFQHISKLVNSTNSQQPNIVQTNLNFSTLMTNTQTLPPQNAPSTVKNSDKPSINSLQEDGTFTNSKFNSSNPSINKLVTPNIQQQISSLVNNLFANTSSDKDSVLHLESELNKKEQSDYHFTSIPKTVTSSKPAENKTQKETVIEENSATFKVEPITDGSSEKSKLYNRVSNKNKEQLVEKMKSKSDEQDLNKPITNNDQFYQQVGKGNIPNNNTSTDEMREDIKKVSDQKDNKLKNTKVFSSIHELNSSRHFTAAENNFQSKKTNQDEQNNNTVTNEIKKANVKKTTDEKDGDFKNNVLGSTHKTDHEANSMDNKFRGEEQNQKLTNGPEGMDSNSTSMLAKETSSKNLGDQIQVNKTITNNQVSKTEKPSPLLHTTSGFQSKNILSTSHKRTANELTTTDSLIKQKTLQINITENLSKTEYNKENSKDLHNERNNNEQNFPVKLMKYINDSVNSEANDQTVEQDPKKLTTSSAIFFSDIDNLLPNPTTEEQNSASSITSYKPSTLVKQVNLQISAITTEKPFGEMGKKFLETKEIFVDQQDAIRAASNLNPILPVDEHKSSQNNLYDEPEPILKDLDKDNVDDNTADALNQMMGLKQPREKTKWTESKKQAKTLHQNEKNKNIFASLSESVTERNKEQLMQNKASLIHRKLSKKMSKI